jgi:UDP-N-acetylmuramoyl-L-alanyl-D-glutamate--2,6-diaminopimelate ligase
MKAIIKKIFPQFLIDIYHYFSSLAGALIYRLPSKEIKVIAITGTNGKSSVVNLVRHILEEAGFKVATSSSISFQIGDQQEPNTLRMTMPDGFYLQGFLRRAVNEKCDYVVLEVTSEGIKQYRHKFINFELAVITNLTPEHIEAHKGFENYKKAKSQLFKIVKKIHILNLDDEYFEYFSQFSAKEKYGYGLSELRPTESDNVSISNIHKVLADNVSTSDSGVHFSVSDIEIHLNLLGKFNVYNALAAICIGLSQGINLGTCKKGLEKANGIPGRMETVISDTFKVIVDYAFTPNALEQVYETIKGNPNTSKMICVLGACGGGRDKWKRPILGELAARYCDKVIVTNEDPYDEDPMEIINQVVDGAGSKAIKILARREAIGQALALANPGDVVIITGKGCEPSICLANDKKISWDDRRVAREEFNKLKNNS